MVFSSIEFLFYFLPAFLLLYAFLPWKNTTLAIGSLFFYAWGEGFYVVVMVFSIVINYLCGKWIYSSTGRGRNLALTAGIVINLGILIFFKYTGFIVHDVLRLNSFPVEFIPRLPLGISFFTFQAMSYLIDLYRREARPATSLLSLVAYISMFPQLIAGPIVRYSSVANALRRRATTLRHVYHGLLFFAVGLGQKVLIADTMAGVVDPIFALETSEVSTQVAWTGALAYTLQIYFDFSGYSSMAIGLGLIFGFKFPQNFNYPYISASITEFWRRWHISLSSWFRDYLYIPLGGNRKGSLRTYVNLFTVFALCGLWHGASWTFVAWGLYHGIILVAERLLKSRVKLRIPRLVMMPYALLMVVLGWVLFRAESFGQAAYFISAMFGNDTATTYSPTPDMFVTHQAIITAIVAIILSFRAGPWIGQWLISLPSLDTRNTRLAPVKTFNGLVLAILLTLTSMLMVLAGSYSAFIYFRF